MSAPGPRRTAVHLPTALSRSAVDDVQLPVQERSERQRERILAALTKVFAERGYHDAGVDRLVAVGRVSMSGFYERFESKEGCFVALYEQLSAAAEASVEAASPADAGWVERTVAGIDALANHVVEEPMAARVVLLEAQSAGPEAVRRYNQDLGRAADFLRLGRSQGVAARALPVGFEEMTVAGLAWMLETRVAAGRIGDPDALAREMAEVALEPYLGLTKARRSISSYSGRSSSS